MLTLQYWREYRTYFHIAQDWGIHEATAHRTVKRIEDILSRAEEFHLPGQRQLQQAHTEIEVIVVDVTEMEIERPKKNKSATIARQKREELFSPLIALANKNAIHSNFS